MNTKALYNLSYGVYLLSAKDDDKDNACVINTAVQVANNPTRISIAAINGNLTTDMIAKTGKFNLSAITEEAEFSLFRHFGMQSGRDADKFADFTDTARSENGLLYLTKWSNAFMSLKVLESHDLGSHTLFIGELVDAEVIGSARSCTYGYYQSTIKKSAQKPADTKKGWRCAVCGYVYEGDELPEDFVCPICKHGPQDFERIGENVSAPEKKTGNVKKWRCTICGEIVESETRPEACPLCKAPGEKFVEVTEELSWVTEHEVGVAKDVSEEIKEMLRANFNGECSEVGMYLAMARVAHREGYPEIGLYWEKAAYEEAEHAAKFAELLGECVSTSTKENLSVRVAAENGACAGKMELAKLAKQNNLDAIHDTVHEMAKDEARHGRAFAGLLKRYFG